MVLVCGEPMTPGVAGVTMVMGMTGVRWLDMLSVGAVMVVRSGRHVAVVDVTIGRYGGVEDVSWMSARFFFCFCSELEWRLLVL